MSLYKGHENHPFHSLPSSEVERIALSAERRGDVSMAKVYRRIIADRAAEEPTKAVGILDAFYDKWVKQ